MKVTVLCIVMCVCAVAVAQPHREPRSPDEQKDKDGGWSVGADKTREGGTEVKVEGQRKWDVTKDGKVQAEVHGHWDRTYGGRQDGNRDHGFGGSIGGSWGK